MKNSEPTSIADIHSRDDELREAISRWHARESLTEKQEELIDEARRGVLARAHGVDL